jgi:23S rRNA (adenine-N6)-dimethyltransferase
VAGYSGPWGFHELSRRWASKLIDLADIKAGDLVLDVGAGTGVVTAELVRAGGSVIAIELYDRRAATLRQRFADLPVKVVRADAADLRLPRRPFKVVANPPFGITTALLRRLTQPSSQLIGAALVLPAWATMRWTTGHGVGGVTSKRTFSFSAGPTIPAHAFRPPPPRSPRVLLIARTQLR